MTVVKISLVSVCLKFWLVFENHRLDDNRNHRRLTCLYPITRTIHFQSNLCRSHHLSQLLLLWECSSSSGEGESGESGESGDGESGDGESCVF